MNQWVQRFKVGKNTSVKKQQTVEKKDPIWYATGINKLINQQALYTLFVNKEKTLVKQRNTTNCEYYVEHDS